MPTLPAHLPERRTMNMNEARIDGQVQPVVRQPKYPCTECSSDAHIGFSAWLKGGNGTVVIRDDERLCLKCAKKRGIEFF